MVASRWPHRLPFRAAPINRSTSRSVRYLRPLLTEEKTVFGPAALGIINPCIWPISGLQLGDNRPFFTQPVNSIPSVGFECYHFIETSRRREFFSATAATCGHHDPEDATQTTHYGVLHASTAADQQRTRTEP